MVLGLVLAAFASGCGVRSFVTVSERKLDDKVRVWLGGGGNSTALIHGPEAFLVDTKLAGYSRGLYREIENTLDHHVARVLLTHVHSDHTGGRWTFDGAGAVLVHPSAKARLVREDELAEPRRSVPYVEVEQGMQLTLGGEVVQVLYLGRGHTEGDLVALFPRQGVLAAGDLLLNGYEPLADEASGGNILELRRTVDRLMQLPFERVVPGHGEVMTREQAEHVRAYLAALEAAVRGALVEGLTEDQAASRLRLPGFEDLKPVPFRADRAGNVRNMYRAVVQEAKSSTP